MPNGDAQAATLVGGTVYRNIRYANRSWQGAKPRDTRSTVTFIAHAVA